MLLRANVLTESLYFFEEENFSYLDDFILSVLSLNTFSWLLFWLFDREKLLHLAVDYDYIALLVLMKASYLVNHLAWRV